MKPPPGNTALALARAAANVGRFGDTPPPTLRRQRQNDHLDTPSAAQNCAMLHPACAKRCSRARHCDCAVALSASAPNSNIPSPATIDTAAILGQAPACEYNAADLPVTHQ